MKNTRNTIGRSPIIAERIRKINGGFVFVPHSFLHKGFFASLNRDELLLYYFLIQAGDRNGVSFYAYDLICTLLFLPDEKYLMARNGLIEKDLIAFDGRRFQVLSLPPRPRLSPSKPLETAEDFEESDPATIRQIVKNHFHQTRDE